MDRNVIDPRLLPQISNTAERQPKPPKFHGGEHRFKVSRKVGENNSGKCHMSRHYQADHKELQFNVTKLLASTTGPKSAQMSPKQEGGPNCFQIKSGLRSDNQAGDHVVRNEAVVTPVTSTLAQSDSTTLQHQKPPTTAPPLNIHNPSHTMTYPNNTKYPLHPHPTMPKLPRIRPRSFTDVYDHHDTPESFKTTIRQIRARCDFEFMTVRHLILTYTRATNQQDTAYESLRRYTSTDCLRRVHKFVTDAIGPSDLDARAVGLGLLGDTVVECALIYTIGLERVHLPGNGVWPDGTILGLAERQRRYFCCEMQAMKLCLHTVQRMVQIWRGRVDDLARMSAGRMVPGNMEHLNVGDYQMPGY